MATVTGLGNRCAYGAERSLHMGNFVWISTGIFSAAVLALAFLGYVEIGTVEEAAANLIASIVSGVPFAVVSTLKFGPAVSDSQSR